MDGERESQGTSYLVQLDNDDLMMKFGATLHFFKKNLKMKYFCIFLKYKIKFQ